MTLSVYPNYRKEIVMFTTFLNTNTKRNEKDSKIKKAKKICHRREKILYIFYT